MYLFLILIFAVDFWLYFPTSPHVLQFVDVCQILYIKKKKTD